MAAVSVHSYRPYSSLSNSVNFKILIGWVWLITIVYNAVTQASVTLEWQKNGRFVLQLCETVSLLSENNLCWP